MISPYKSGNHFNIDPLILTLLFRTDNMLTYLFLLYFNMQIYLFSFIKTGKVANLPFHAHLPFSFFGSIDIPLFRNFYLNLNPFSDIRVEPSCLFVIFWPFQKKNWQCFKPYIGHFHQTAESKSILPQLPTVFIFF